MLKTIHFNPKSQKPEEFHLPNPFRNSKKVVAIEGWFQLNRTMQYIIPEIQVLNPDQTDWIKICGMYFIRPWRIDDYWNPDRNANLIGFRYHPDVGPQLCYYTNRLGKKFETQQILTMENISNKVFFKIGRDRMMLHIAGNTVEDQDFLPIDVSPVKHWKIDFANPHFGGTALPPNPIHFDLQWDWVRK